MVFCCIAIVAFAIMYFCFLTIRQLFSRPRRDKSFPGKVPPRAITGNGAWPVYGHTRFFTKWGGNVALMFSPDMYEWSGCVGCRSRQLGILYSIFIWGEWRIVIQGADRVQKILRQSSLKEGWPWTPPLTLLGKSCLDLLEPADADVLANFLQASLRPSEVLCFAPVFAEAAEVNLQSIIDRKSQQQNISHGSKRHSNKAEASLVDQDDDDRILDDKTHKIKWEALRSYTLDLIDGPILNMNMWTTPATSPSKNDPNVENEKNENDVEQGLPVERDNENNENAVSGSRHAAEKQSKSADAKQPDRHLALLWMERVKAGLCVIKLTFGPEWMQIWRMNEYGRAVNARRYIETLISDHVAERVKETATTITHAPGHFIHDWLTAPFPLLTLTENLMHLREGVLGDGKSSRPVRLRSQSDSMVITAFRSSDWDDNNEKESSKDIMHPTVLKTEQDLASPQFESPQRSSKKVKAMINAMKAATMETPTGSDGNASGVQNSLITFAPVVSAIPFTIEPSLSQPGERPLNQQNGCDNDPPTEMARKENNVDETTFAANTPVDSPTHDHTNTYFGNNQLRPLPLLDRIIRQEEREGKGISQATMTEVSILLWMVMDAGNAWTAMALNLISSNEEALVMVQDELDYLVQIYGREQLFTPIVLARMKHLDALLFEAIRLCPPFLGGMKVTQETVVFEELDLQVPKNCNVFFCQPTNENFDLANAVGKRPEMLGFQYPCVELHGFLPLKGLEVPLMVLQSKVFLAVLLQRFSPYLSKRRTFIRRVTEVLTCSVRPKESVESCSVGKVQGESMDPIQSLQTSDDFRQAESLDQTASSKRNEVTQSDAMRLFTKIPFPEPRRVIHIRERDGVASFEPTTPSLV